MSSVKIQIEKSTPPTMEKLPSLKRKDRPRGSRLLPGTARAAMHKRLASDGRGGGISAGARDTMDGDIVSQTSSSPPKEPEPKDASPKEPAPTSPTSMVSFAPKDASPLAADKQHQQRLQQLEVQVDSGLALGAAVAANNEERAKTQEMERALELLCQQEEEANQRLLSAESATASASTAVATALATLATALAKTPAAADQVLPCSGDAFNKCLHGRSFVWTVKQQEDHLRSFGAAGPRPARCSACRKRWRNRKQWT